MKLTLVYTLLARIIRVTKTVIFMTLTRHFPGVRRDGSTGLQGDGDQRLPLAADCHRKSDLICGVLPTHCYSWNKIRSSLPLKDVGGCERAALYCSGLYVKVRLIAGRPS